MRTVLIIDDRQDVIDLLVEEIPRAIQGVTCVPERDFARAVQQVESIRPDAVILDLLEGAGVVDPPGQRTWQLIWTSGRFCPVIIYTAFDGELTPPVPSDHPFVKLVHKGQGSEARVIEHLQAFTPLVGALGSLHREIDLVVQRVLRDTVGAAVIGGNDATRLIHAARRRVAALMDEKTAAEGRELFSWEQYLVPALGDSPLTGDLLRTQGADWRSVESYRLILTPSCDLVRGRHEPTVLVAKCTGPVTLKTRLSLPANVDKATDRLKSGILTQGHMNGLFPLPEFPDRIPLLVASMQDLEVIRYEQIGSTETDGTSYDRVASIDSPFREQVAWAFLSTVARPGMPDRDLASWARQIAQVANTPTPPPSNQPG